MLEYPIVNKPVFNRKGGFLLLRESALLQNFGYVPGHGGDVWWVSHDESKDIGAYMFDEFEKL